MSGLSIFFSGGQSAVLIVEPGPQKSKDLPLESERIHFGWSGILGTGGFCQLRTLQQRRYQVILSEVNTTGVLVAMTTSFSGV